MSTNLIHVLTLIGTAAEEAEAAYDELLGRRVERQPTIYGTDDWSESDHKDIESYCKRLIDAARELPVLYYAAYLDSWLVADSRFDLLKWPDGKRRKICSPWFSMAFYPSRHAQAILAQIKGKRRTKLYREQSEDRWFLDHMKEAVENAQWLQAPFLVVSISQLLGASRTDEETKAALDRSLACPKH